MNKFALICLALSLSVAAAAPRSSGGDANCPGQSVLAQVCRLVNQQRLAYGLRPLKMVGALNQMAYSWAAEMEYRRAQKQITHGNFAERAAQYGSLAENVAYRGFPNQNNPEGAMHGWMNSPGHRANILNPSFRYIGVGHVSTYWTQEFSR